MIVYMTECIIPAAGTSSRMRAWKLFLPYQDKPVIRHVIDAALRGADRVILVSGFRSDALQEFIDSLNEEITFLDNTGYRQGMFSSLQTGMRESRGDSVFVLHADLPLVTSKTFSDLLAYRDSADIIQPVHNGVPGHPVLMNGRARELVLSQPVTSSMQEVFSLCSYRQVAWDDPAVITDIDTPETYQKLLLQGH